jgi:hypothetical protein
VNGLKENAGDRALGRKVKEIRDRVQTHVKEHREAYIGVAVGGLIVGACMRRPIQIAPNIAPVIAPVITNNNVVISALGDPGNVVECVETGMKYASQGQLARTIGTSATNVANHLHGKLPDLYGLHYQVIGKAGHSLA